MNATLKLIHGNGGSETTQLIKDVFYKHFQNSILMEGMDSAILDIGKEQVAFTTDSFVVKPIVFSGGDIGKLAVCGTINDLCAAGAKPLYMSCGMIIEEGFDRILLERIVKSMAETAAQAGVQIVTGDTKVVEKGAVDQLFINTTGIGIIVDKYYAKKIVPGDKVILTGTIAEHGTTIALERYQLKVHGRFESDCAPMNNIIEKIANHIESIKRMKDPTRGGIATALNEIAAYAGLGIHLYEEEIPIRREVRAITDLLGIDPLYLACEGRMLLVVKEEETQQVLESIRQLDSCLDAQIIGSFIPDSDKMVFIENAFGGKRMIYSLEGEMLPRIC